MTRLGYDFIQVLRNLDADESADVGVAKPCQLVGGVAINLHATDLRYLKLYNTALAATVGTTVPKMTIPLKAGVPTPFECQAGIDFTVGISIGATTGVADADTGAPATNDVVVNLFYK